MRQKQKQKQVVNVKNVIQINKNKKPSKRNFANKTKQPQPQSYFPFPQIHFMQQPQPLQNNNELINALGSINTRLKTNEDIIKQIYEHKPVMMNNTVADNTVLDSMNKINTIPNQIDDELPKYMEEEAQEESSQSVPDTIGDVLNRDYYISTKGKVKKGKLTEMLAKLKQYNPSYPWENKNNDYLSGGALFDDVVNSIKKTSP